jgi:hypothetical protein
MLDPLCRTDEHEVDGSIVLLLAFRDDVLAFLDQSFFSACRISRS